MNVCCIRLCFCYYTLWTDFCEIKSENAEKCHSFSCLMNLALSQFLHLITYNHLTQYRLCISHKHLDAVSCPDSTTSKQHRSPCFSEWLEITGAFGRNPNRLSHVFALFCFDRKWCNTHLCSRYLNPWYLFLAARALKIGQQCKTLPQKDKETPWKNSTGISSVVLDHGICFHWLLSQSALRWKHSSH